MDIQGFLGIKATIPLLRFYAKSKPFIVFRINV